MSLVHSFVPPHKSVSYDDFLMCFKASGIADHFSISSLTILYEFYNEKDVPVNLNVKSICDEWEECDIDYFIEQHPEAKEYFGETINWEKLNEKYGAIEIHTGRITYNKLY